MSDGRGSRLPSLGPRGEGWVAAQLALLSAILLAGLASGAPGTSGHDVLVRAVGVVALSGGAMLILGGAVALGRGLTPLPRPRDDARLVESGVFGLVRHPLYGGLVLGALGWSVVMLNLPALALTAVLGVVLDLKSRLEEGWLRERFSGYDAYARRTQRLIPWLY